MPKLKRLPSRIGPYRERERCDFEDERERERIDEEDEMERQWRTRNE
jgi:hypothetical protein